MKFIIKLFLLFFAHYFNSVEMKLGRAVIAYYAAFDALAVCDCSENIREYDRENMDMAITDFLSLI